MDRRMRRGLVMVAVAVSIVGGLFSVRVAADLAEAAAPPPAPPISLSTLKGQLADEQARTAALQQQLDELVGATGELTSALDATEGQVNADGTTAAQLRSRLKAAEARLKQVTALLKKASQRLAALGVAGPTVPPTSKPAGNAGGGTPKPTAPPAGTSASTFSLSLDLSGNDVVATWTTCSASGFDSYALVRSLDSEIHYPPEDLDTLVARVSSKSSTTFTDTGAPSKKLWYRVYCLTSSGGEIRTGATTKTVAITVP